MVCRGKEAAWKDGDMVILLTVAYRQFSLHTRCYCVNIMGKK